MIYENNKIIKHFNKYKALPISICEAIKMYKKYFFNRD